MYNVRLVPSFVGPSRRRAGLELFPAQTLTVELTEDQLSALEADEQIIVESVKGQKTVELVEAPAPKKLSKSKKK